MKDKLVFVVDDDPLVTGLVERRLGSAGYNMRSFAYGEECIAALDEKPDLVILDFYFRREGSEPMNGMQVYDKIRDKIPGLPVIILSAQENGDIVLELARKGIADYVIKDSSVINNLLASLKEIFDR